MPSSWRTSAWCVALTLLVPLSAMAGLPVALPPEESPEQWRDALEAAGLEVAMSWRGAQVRIQSGVEWWRVVVLEDGRIVRELTVPTPTTDAERREIAVLARALSTNLEPPEAPSPGALPTRPPPPPPFLHAEPAPPPVAAAPTEPEPAQTGAPSADSEHAESLAVEVVEPDSPVEAPSTGSLDDEPQIVDELDLALADIAPEPKLAPVPLPPTVRSVPATPITRRVTRRERRIIGAPAMGFYVGASSRTLATAAGHVSLSLDAAHLGRGVVLAEVAVQPRRPMSRLADERAFSMRRSYTDLRALGGLGVQVLQELRVSAVLGAAQRTWAQQSAVVDVGFMPLAGGQLELTSGDLFRVGVRGQALADLRPTELIDSLGNVQRLRRVDLGGAVVVRLHPRPPKRPLHEVPARAADKEKRPALDPIDDLPTLTD